MLRSALATGLSHTVAALCGAAVLQVFQCGQVLAPAFTATPPHEISPRLVLDTVNGRESAKSPAAQILEHILSVSRSGTLFPRKIGGGEIDG